jgi:hypothetical protein
MKSEKTRWLIGIAITLCIALFTWLLNREKSTILNIEKVSETQLTKSLNVEGLSSKYYYNDSIEVQSLWQSIFVIRNVGRKTIYGEGFAESSIRGSHIPLIVEDSDNILSITVSKDNCGAELIDTFNLVFAQWRPKEYVEITVLTDGEKPSVLRISDRDIADSQITYSVYSPEIEDNSSKLIDYLPKGLVNFIKWLIVLCITIFSISNVWGIENQIKTRPYSKGVMISSIIAMIILQIGLLLSLLWILP